MQSGFGLGGGRGPGGGGREREVDECRLYVGYLPLATDEHSLRELFEPLGIILESKACAPSPLPSCRR